MRSGAEFHCTFFRSPAQLKKAKPEEISIT
jgi:hypothetical protein